MARPLDRQRRRHVRSELSRREGPRPVARGDTDIAAEVAGAPRPWVIAACIGLLCLIWGSTWLVIAEGLHDLPPFTSVAARFAVAGGLMALIAPTLHRLEGGSRPPRWLNWTHGIFGLTISYALVYRTETHLPSGLVSLLWAVFPLCTAVIAHILLPGERLRRRQWFGLVIGIIGVAVLLATDVADIGPSALPVGPLLLLSPVSAALGQNVVKRNGAGVSSVLLNRNGMLIAAAALTLLALLTETSEPMRWTAAALGSIAYLAAVGTVVSFGIYYWLLRHTRATRLSMISYATPVVAVILGTTLADEPFGLHTIVGGLLVLIGVGFVLRAK